MLTENLHQCPLALRIKPTPLLAYRPQKRCLFPMLLTKFMVHRTHPIMVWAPEQILWPVTLPYRVYASSVPSFRALLRAMSYGKFLSDLSAQSCQMLSKKAGVSSHTQTS